MSDCVRPDPPGADEGDPGPGGAAMPQTGLRVWRNPAFQRIPPLWIQNGANGAPDTITVAYGEGASGSFRDAALRNNIAAGQSTAAIVTTLGESAAFMADELALLVDTSAADLDRGCMLFQITGIDPSPTRSCTPRPPPPGTRWRTWRTWSPTRRRAINPPNSTGGIRRFGQLIFVQFAIDSTGAPATPPRLTMNLLTGNQGPQVLAEGIEDMQIAYACDRLPPGARDGISRGGRPRGPAERRVGLQPPARRRRPVDCKRPDAIRITLMVRSLNTDSSLADFSANSKPSAEDGAAGSNDMYRHRVATTTVYPRN